MTAHLWWYVARSCGITSWALVTASVLWGLVLSSKALRRRLSPAWLLDLHRYLGGLGVIFLGLHLGGLVGDSYVHFGPAEVLVPLASRWRPGAVAWGVVAFYLFVAVELTSLARRRLPLKVWRATHGLSFPLYALATAHLLLAGTDANGGPLYVAAWASALTVAAATAARLVLARKVRYARVRRKADAVVAAAAAVAGHGGMNADQRFAAPSAPVPGALVPRTTVPRTTVPTPDDRRAAIAVARARSAADATRAPAETL